ncbi:MAG TPA: bifunctional homocysteine S-methyltransferase/methylenetetrahydrofolate reductase, partial [Longimicrobiales bacterium]
MMSPFRDLLTDPRPHVFDGAMGTMLYQKGIFINRCYDELNLKEPELVKEIHRAYVQAGAELVETNSFGANRVKLAQYGLEDRVAELNERAARLAREAVGERALVGGSIGPLGIRIEPFGPTSVEEARALFREQAEALLEGGVDFFVLETFSDLEEIRQALRAVRELGDVPVVAQMTVQEQGDTAYGTAPETCAARLEEWGADVVGFNCSVGPHGVLEAIERIAPRTRARLSAQPNAGMPRDVHGRKIYMASPEYMAKFAERLIRAGAKFVGGCCGTTPEHIRAMCEFVRPLSPRFAQAGGGVSTAAAPPVLRDVAHRAPDVQAMPLAQRSKWGARLAAGAFVTSVEIVPPRGVDATRMLADVRKLKVANVDAVNVPDGPRAQSRMGALLTSLLIEQQVGIETVTHYACRDRNLLGMLSDLLGAAAIGLRNLLLITGDPPKMGPYPSATAVFDIDAIGLTNLVRNLNHGRDPGDNAIGAPTQFVIGVGVNPAPIDLAHELKRFAWKVEAGAEFAVTQPVFDATQLEHFLRRTEGQRPPIVAGIWPLVSVRNAEFLANEVPGVTVPDEIIARMRRANEKSKEHAIAEGIAIAR